MNMEYINPFIEACIDVISQTTGIKPQTEEVFTNKTPYSSDNVIVMIGLTGMMRGSVNLSLSEETACNIASAMMGGMSVPSLDEIAKSAVAELCNMIMGNSARLLSLKNVIIDVTPPTVLTGDNIKLSIHDSVITCIPLKLGDKETVELDISFEMKKR